MIITATAVETLGDMLAETEQGRTFLREQWQEERAARLAAEETGQTEEERARLRLLLPETYRVERAYSDRSEMPTPYRVTVLPSLGTEDVDAVISERVEVVSESETVGADGSVTCRATVRLWTGSVHYGTTDGSAVGSLEETKRLRSDARKDAERAARRYRSEMRSRDVVLGSDAPTAPSVSGESCPVSGADYRRLRNYVARRAYGNAADGSRSAHVRAGVSALGVPVTPETVADGTMAAVMILCRWATEGLPESLAERAEEMREAGEDVTPLLLGSAARDGLRSVTGSDRPTALATARARYRARLAADPRRNGPDSPISDRGNVLRNAAPVSAARSEYVAAARSERITAVVLSRRADGSLAFPTLAALLLLDSGEERGTGGVAAVARLLLGSSSGSARRTVGARLRAEWLAAEGLRLPETADDSGDALRSGAVTLAR